MSSVRRFPVTISAREAPYLVCKSCDRKVKGRYLPLSGKDHFDYLGGYWTWEETDWECIEYSNYCPECVPKAVAYHRLK